MHRWTRSLPLYGLLLGGLLSGCRNCNQFKLSDPKPTRPHEITYDSLTRIGFLPSGAQCDTLSTPHWDAIQPFDLPQNSSEDVDFPVVGEPSSQSPERLLAQLCIFKSKVRNPDASQLAATVNWRRQPNLGVNDAWGFDRKIINPQASLSDDVYTQMHSQYACAVPRVEGNAGDPVRVVAIDTATNPEAWLPPQCRRPTQSEQTTDASGHGAMVRHVIASVACPPSPTRAASPCRPSCPYLKGNKPELILGLGNGTVDVRSQPPARGIPLNQSGEAGTFADVLFGLREVINSHDRDEKTIVNMSFGWLPTYGKGETPDDAGPYAIRLALEALRCKGALLVAAAGNRSGTNTDWESGMLLPGGWEEDRRFLTTCAQNTNGPLLYAVGAADGTGKVLSTRRPQGTPRRVAPGFQFPWNNAKAWTESQALALNAQPVLNRAGSGSSISSAFVSGLAARMWSNAPSLSPDQLMNSIMQNFGFTVQYRDEGTMKRTRWIGRESGCQSPINLRDALQAERRIGLKVGPLTVNGETIYAPSASSPQAASTLGDNVMSQNAVPVVTPQPGDEMCPYCQFEDTGGTWVLAGEPVPAEDANVVQVMLVLTMAATGEDRKVDLGPNAIDVFTNEDPFEFFIEGLGSDPIEEVRLLYYLQSTDSAGNLIDPPYTFEEPVTML